MMKSIPILLALLCAACQPAGVARTEDPAPARLPNIIFIMADDLGYGDLGAYGQELIATPHLDRMAEEGMRFTDFYAGSTVCAPSRSVLMTGRHVGRTEIRGNREVQPMGQQPLSPEAITVADVLKKAGYSTALIGKWGLGGPGSTGEPRKKGFDYFFGYLCQRHAHNYYPEFLFRNEETVRLHGNVVPDDRPDGAGTATERAQYSHDLFAEDAIRFIRENGQRPFFLYLSLTIPHANNEMFRATGFGNEVPDFGPYHDRQWSDGNKGLAAMISRMDSDIGRMLATLKQLGIDEQTLVIFTSDNGPHREGGNDPAFFQSSGPLRGIKRDLYEGGIRVPLIARWPGRIAAGTVSDHISYQGDVMATVADLAGVPPPDDIDSISMLPVLLGRTGQRQHRYLYWEFYEGQGGAQAIRMDQWKAVRKPFFEGAIELYDLSFDISEQNDVSGSHPGIVSQIEALMEEAHEPSPLWVVRR